MWRRDGSLYLTTGPSTETRLDTGKDAAIVATSRGIYAAWSSGREIRAQLPGGGKPITLADDGAYVQLAALPNGDVVAAWESHGSIAIRLLSGGDGGAKGDAKMSLKSTLTGRAVPNSAGS